MCSPALIVSNHEAQHFPVIHNAEQVGQQIALSAFATEAT